MAQPLRAQMGNVKTGFTKQVDVIVVWYSVTDIGILYSGQFHLQGKMGKVIQKQGFAPFFFQIEKRS
jgi:Leu/Phe-tRNA-protein transferase